MLRVKYMPKINHLLKWMHFGVLGDAFSFPRQVIIVDVDEAGNIVRSLQSQKSNVRK